MPTHVCKPPNRASSVTPHHIAGRDPRAPGSRFLLILTTTVGLRGQGPGCAPVAAHFRQAVEGSRTVTGGTGHRGELDTVNRQLRRGRPRSFLEWRTLRRWDKLPAWEIDLPGYVLRLSREQAGLTQTQLATALGITQQAVSRAERWQSNPTVGLLTRWLAACGKRVMLNVEDARE